MSNQYTDSIYSILETDTMNTDKTVYVVIGGTSGIGAEVARQLNNKNSVVHVASRKTGLDISDEQSVYYYFEDIGAFDHLIITAGSYAPTGSVVEVGLAEAKSAFLLISLQVPILVSD